MQARSVVAFALFLVLQSAAQGQSTPPAEILRSLLELDADKDRAVSRSEIPEAARDSFDILLKHGDQNGNGLLDGDEFRTLVQRLREAGPAAINPAEARRRLRAADKNGDGLISPDEFPGMPTMFDRLDRDGNGALSPQELRRAAAAPTTPESTSVGQRLRRQDRDGDGRITRDEFRGAAAQFDRLDRDGNGVLEASEIGGPVAKAKAASAETSRKDGKPKPKPEKEPVREKNEESPRPAPPATGADFSTPG